MSTHLYLAPAAAGKTAYSLDLARTTAQGLAAEPRIVVASHLQVRAARRRLAEMGGAIGVRVLTFDRLCEEVLNAAGEIYTTLSEPVQYRLLRALLDSTLPVGGSLDLSSSPLPAGGGTEERSLRHYAPLINRPGFVQVLQRLIGELKAACIHPDDFARAVRAMGGEPRLAELAQIYGAYQGRLQAQRWADRAGMGWLAVEVLRERAPHVAQDWPLLAVDGFDSFTPVQVALLNVLGGRVNNVIITLTWNPSGEVRSLAHRRFARTQRDLEDALHLHAEPLPPLSDLGGLQRPPRSFALEHLERQLFRPAVARVDGAGAVELIEAPDRPAEVRAALRWLKARLRLEGCRPAEIALLARNLTPYRPFVQQTAAEFGLPVRLVAGLPLRANPAVAALLNLLNMILPGADGEPALPRRAVVEAWRSPYFDWSAPPDDSTGEPIGIQPGDADDLDTLARWGRVIGGQAQWFEAFDRQAGLAGELAEEEDRGWPAGLARGGAARTLQARFMRFVERLTPPAGSHSYREFVGWLEALIGEDTSAEDPSSLRVVARARAAAGPAIAERDLAALVALKDVLRGLVWAEEALHTPTVDLARFVTELSGAVDIASYNLPVQAGREEILVADVVQARGLPFRAVAVIGLAEGEFPATLREDPFLRDTDRRRLLDEFRLPLELSTEGAEAGFFYETVTRPSERLLLTRPRLADNGAPWQASPYWEEVRRLVASEPVRLTSENACRPAEVASWPELLESLTARSGNPEVRAWAQKTDPVRMGGAAAAVQVLHARRPGARAGPFDGELSALAGSFAARFGPRRTWSATRLEAYRNCPFSFFVTYVLGLEPREEPSEGLDARQLGNIYHHIFERLYASVKDPADVAKLLDALPTVAGAVLEAAPRAEGFRVTAWWEQTRTEITTNVERSVVALAALPGSYVPLAQETAFGGATALTVTREDDAFRLHGFIDRVDRAPDGRLRIIDYKTSGPWSFTAKAFAEGKKLQLPLYALAAEQALGLGRVADGFYWHVQQAKPSKFSLAGGTQAAIEAALGHAWAAVDGARAGEFVPAPPDDGCPDYCPAAGFCWHTRPRWGA
jgi:RecB family exonuclease/superfamily I DNA/RNA helicase